MGRKVLDYVKELFRRYGDDNGDTAAAAMSFFVLLSFVPILLCGIAVLGFVVRDPASAAKQVQDFLAQLIPSSNSGEISRRLITEMNIEKQVASLMALRGVAAVIGVVSLLWSATRIFVNAIPAMNAAFNATETRNFLWKQVYAFGLFFGAGALFLLSLPVSALPHLPLFDSYPPVLTILIGILAFIGGIAVNAVMYAVIYRYLPSPSANVTWKQAFVGGTAMAVVWEILKQIFAVYLSRFGGSHGYEKAYGSLGGIIIAILWVYYSSMLLLLGAQAAQMYGEQQSERAKDPADVRAPKPEETEVASIDTGEPRHSHHRKRTA